MVLPETAQHFFCKKKVTRNREPIEAKKKSDSEHPKKRKRKKMKRIKRKEAKRKQQQQQNRKTRKEKKEVPKRQKMDHLRMYTFAWRILESRHRMCGFSWEQSASSGCNCSPGNLERGTVSHRAAPFFPLARDKLFQKEYGSPPARDCEGTARELRGQVF